MIEQPETVNDVKGAESLRIETLNISNMGVNVREPTPQLDDVVQPAIDRDDCATALGLKRNEVANATAGIQHAQILDRKPGVFEPRQPRTVDRKCVGSVEGYLGSAAVWAQLICQLSR